MSQLALIWIQPSKVDVVDIVDIVDIVNIYRWNVSHSLHSWLCGYSEYSNYAGNSTQVNSTGLNMGKPRKTYVNLGKLR